MRLGFLPRLLHGKTGTGKTTAACSFSPEYERVTLNQSQFADALFGKFLLKDGSTHWANACATRAALKGCPLVLDEIHKAGGELDAPLQSVLDDAAICRLNLDNGETVTPQVGYRVIATMNGSPDDQPKLSWTGSTLFCGATHRIAESFGGFLLSRRLSFSIKWRMSL